MSVCVCKYCGKEFDSPQKLGGHIIRCKLNPKYEQNKINCSNRHRHNFNKKPKDVSIYYCQYCNKELVGKNALTQHEIRCKENPNRIEIYIGNFNRRGHKGTNQFIKAQQLNLPKPEVSEETRQKLREKSIGRYHNDSTKEKIRLGICKHIENDDWHNHFITPILYNGEYYDSSWEVEFAKYLENHNIEFIRNKSESFDYFWKGSIHRYIPDFYLPKFDLYIEVKGMWSERDVCKWDQFPYKLDIYDSKDLFDLGLIKGYDKRIMVEERFRLKHIKLDEETSLSKE